MQRNTDSGSMNLRNLTAAITPIVKNIFLCALIGLLVHFAVSCHSNIVEGNVFISALMDLTEDTETEFEPPHIRLIQINSDLTGREFSEALIYPLSFQEIAFGIAHEVPIPPPKG